MGDGSPSHNLEAFGCLLRAAPATVLQLPTGQLTTDTTWRRGKERCPHVGPKKLCQEAVAIGQ